MNASTIKMFLDFFLVFIKKAKNIGEANFRAALDKNKPFVEITVRAKQ